jgi:hypothetical protein
METPSVSAKSSPSGIVAPLYDPRRTQHGFAFKYLMLSRKQPPFGRRRNRSAFAHSGELG